MYKKERPDMFKRWQSSILPILLVLLSTSASNSKALGQKLAKDSAQEHDSMTILPGDVLSVHVLNVPDLEQLHLRVTDQGDLPLMLLGSVNVAGLTPASAGQKVAAAYRAQHMLRNTDVEITVDQFASAEVTVLGYVVGQSLTSQTNGTLVPLTTPKSLLTVLSMAGGFNDRASRTVTIQRRDRRVAPFAIYLPNDPMQAIANNVLIYPGDMVMVPRAGIVYVLGNVGRPSGIYMNEDGRLNLMEALSQAGSTLPNSALRNVMIFRWNAGQYTRLHINVGKIIKGEAPSPDLSPRDVIWVPFSYGKNTLINGAQIVAAVSSATATGIVYTH
jgi:polysaccharide biosynthesis/export protein